MMRKSNKKIEGLTNVVAFFMVLIFLLSLLIPYLVYYSTFLNVGPALKMQSDNFNNIKETLVRQIENGYPSINYSYYKGKYNITVQFYHRVGVYYSEPLYNTTGAGVPYLGINITSIFYFNPNKDEWCLVNPPINVKEEFTYDQYKSFTYHGYPITLTFQYNGQDNVNYPYPVYYICLPSSVNGYPIAIVVSAINSTISDVVYLTINSTVGQGYVQT